MLNELSGDAGAFARQANSQAFLENMRSLFAGEDEAVDALFPANGFHMRLATDESGRCRLLGSEGCALSREARPYYCRLFPFWFKGDALYVFAAQECRAQAEAGTGRRLLTLFDTSEKRLKEVYGRLRLAWGMPPRRVRP